MGKPVLLTPEAATGIDAVDGRDWMLCEPEAEAMAAKVDQLRADPLLARKMGKAAREFVLANHDWDATLAPLTELVRISGSARDAA